ncbi:MAG: flagellar hook-length control protein FliK [Proteobacteria bacterium]|nr:flagellar hook-length control protein FliK [Pseudomonadota bacterium]MBU1639949.1 flagellar hook-length control protein FliK [Pseudomonadota bacterium]
MSNIINPVLPVGGAELSVDHVRGAERSGNKFSDHLDRRLDNNQDRNQDKLGVKRCQEQNGCSENDQAAKGEIKAKPRAEGVVPDAATAVKVAEGEGKNAEGKVEVVEDQDQSDLANLVLFLQDIQQVAQEKILGPGEWSVALPEAEILADLAQQAGMSEADLTALVEQFQSDNGALDLDSFFQALIDHFVSFEENPAIVVSETEFPMLEALFVKMGMTPEQLDVVSSKIVVGDGDIDLALLSQAIEELSIAPESLQPVTLSPWEAEQLQALLDKAGISLGSQLDLMPEQVFSEDLVLSLERLQTLLKATVVQAQDNQPKLDLPKFLGSLEQVMKQASFEDQSVGFIPVVQGSLKEAYKDLLEMYDHARLRFEEGLGTEEDQLQNDIKKWLDGVIARSTDEQGGLGEGKAGKQDFFVGGGKASDELTVSSSGKEFTVSRQDGMTAGQTATDQTISQPVDQPQPVRHFTIQQQQHILNQLSVAVARGMKSGEQHMVLRMFPAELGEVKVDLTVRNEVVSVSFTMANSKVKETLESSMEEFRHNMEQKGFSLSDVNVFVGHNQDDNGADPRFEMAWSGERLQAQNLEDVPADVLYNTVGGRQYVSQEEGVNLFV